MATRTAASARAGSGAAGAAARPAAASAAHLLEPRDDVGVVAPPTTSGAAQRCLAAMRRGRCTPARQLPPPVCGTSAPANDRWLVRRGAGRARTPRARRGSWCRRSRTRSRRRAHALGGVGPLAQFGVDARTASSPSRRWGSGRSKFRLGGSTFSCSASTVLNRPAAPAAALRWPMLDLTEPSAIAAGRGARAPNTSVRLSSSAASPTRVDVPCASISRRPWRVDARPAPTRARSPASDRPGWAR